MKRLALFSGILGGFLSLAACGGDSTGSTSTGAGGAGESTTATATGTGGVGGAGTGTTATATTGSSSTGATGTGGSSAAPEAPMMMSAEKVAGGLHVMWKNMTTDCDKIQLSRKHDAGAYAVAYTLNGAATSQHDTLASPPGMYCYTARCLKGAVASVDSNEKCGTP